MYGMETCVLGGTILRELDYRQRRIASFITGLSPVGGNVALTLESGLLPFEARYHIGLHRFFNRCLKSKSDLVIAALQEHKGREWKSPYKATLETVIMKYGLTHLTSAASKEKILEWTWQEVLREMYSLKSLQSYSVRDSKWELPKHINDSYRRGIISKFRTGNAGLGNRSPTDFGFHSKICPLCKDTGSFKLNESHLTFECKELLVKQEQYGFIGYKKRWEHKNPMRMLLGGDKCTTEELLKRGNSLRKLQDSFLEVMRLKLFS